MPPTDIGGPEHEQNTDPNTNPNTNPNTLDPRLPNPSTNNERLTAPEHEHEQSRTRTDRRTAFRSEQRSNLNMFSARTEQRTPNNVFRTPNAVQGEP